MVYLSSCQIDIPKENQFVRKSILKLNKLDQISTSPDIVQEIQTTSETDRLFNINFFLHLQQRIFKNIVTEVENAQYTFATKSSTHFNNYTIYNNINRDFP